MRAFEQYEEGQNNDGRQKGPLEREHVARSSSSESREGGKKMEATWISSERRACHVYARLCELEEGAEESAGECAKRIGNTGTGRDFGPEQLYNPEWGVFVDRGMDQGGYRAGTATCQQRTTLFFLMRPPD